MAKDKKSFLLYCDTIHTVNKLTDEKAGQLFKHILAYVNDQNPQTNDFVIDIAFEPIKQSLKRDLKRYENKCLTNKENAHKRWNANNATASDRIQTNANDADIDSDIDKDIYIDFDFKKSLIALGIDKKLVSEWLKVRQKKKAVNSETAFNTIKNEIEKSCATPDEVIRMCVVKSWAGFQAEWYVKPKPIEKSFNEMTDEEKMEWMRTGGNK
jgi:hypothetical protein